MTMHAHTSSTYSTLLKVVASHCCVCRRRLTDAESVEHGIGPICSRRFYDPLHVPSEEQVALALGLLQASDLPDTVTYTVFDLRENARKACNTLVYYASAHYEDRDMVFKCSKIIRAFGYEGLADKLEMDRVKVTMKTIRVLDTDPDDRILIKVPYKGGFQADVAWVPGAERIMPDERGKVRWAVPTTQSLFIETLVGYHYADELAFGDQGLVTVRRRSRAEVDNLIHQVRVAKTQPNQPLVPVRIEETAGRDVRFWSPYSRDWIADFKSAIPYMDRKWDSVSRCWVVNRKQIHILKDLARKHFQVDLP